MADPKDYHDVLRSAGWELSTVSGRWAKNIPGQGFVFIPEEELLMIAERAWDAGYESGRAVMS
jgi:hypothetical protein